VSPYTGFLEHDTDTDSGNVVDVGSNRNDWNGFPSACTMSRQEVQRALN